MILALVPSIEVIIVQNEGYSQFIIGEELFPWRAPNKNARHWFVVDLWELVFKALLEFIIFWIHLLMFKRVNFVQIKTFHDIFITFLNQNENLVGIWYESLANLDLFILRRYLDP